jgi:uncharacterized protein YfiM (DUF2279 family)
LSAITKIGQPVSLRSFSKKAMNLSASMAKCRHPRTPIMGEMFKVGFTMPEGLVGSRAAGVSWAIKAVFLVGAQVGIATVNHMHLSDNLS